MSKIFWAESKIDPVTKKASLSMGSEYNRARFADFLKENPGIRFRIDPFTPESKDQRRWFEGALIPFLTYFQENMDFKDRNDLELVRNWVKTEFNGKFITIGGKSLKVAKSTKGELSRGLIDRIMDWAGEQGYPIEYLLPDRYKKWRDEIYGYGGPPTYIEYLESTGELRKLLQK